MPSPPLAASYAALPPVAASFGPQSADESPHLCVSVPLHDDECSLLVSVAGGEQKMVRIGELCVYYIVCIIL